jgi:hypothetical protein
MEQQRTWMTVGALGVLACGIVGCGMSSTATPPPPKAAVAASEQPGEVVEEATVVVQANVVKVDQKARVVTLKNAEGKVFDVKVGDEVKNFAQIKKGDEVVASYYESLAITLKKPGDATPGIESRDTFDRAEPGRKPGGIAASETKITATVVGVDKKKGTVTLKGPQGKTVTVAARDKRRLEPVKVGDLIEATYTEAVAISVEKPIKK